MTRLRDKYPEQFTGPYYLGSSIDGGWVPIAERALERVRRELSAEEMTAFHWVQIKEKFGCLCMYWNCDFVPVTFIDHGGVSTLSVDVQKEGGDASSGEPATETDKKASERARGIQASLRTRIEAIVQSAESEATRTCARCGEPGRLYSDGYWATLCDEHAEGRVFPPVYGEWIGARDNQSIGSSSVSISSQSVMYFRGVALYSWRLEGGGGQDYVFVEEMPVWLIDLARAERLSEEVFVQRSAYIADSVGRLVKDHADELRERTTLVLPDGARINLELAFSYEAARATGVCYLEIEHLVEPRQIAIAGVRFPDSSLRIFKQEHSEISEIDYCPEIFLTRRAKELEQMAATLREMLRDMEGNKE